MLIARSTGRTLFIQYFAVNRRRDALGFSVDEIGLKTSTKRPSRETVRPYRPVSKAVGKLKTKFCF